MFRSVRSPEYGWEGNRKRSRSRSVGQRGYSFEDQSEPSTTQFNRGRKRSASRTPGEEEGRGKSTRRPTKSPRLGKKYYKEYYHGEVQHQYSNDFYRNGAGGIGPHRPPARWLPPVRGDGKNPRQYRGPRPFRSPPKQEEYLPIDFNTSDQKGVLSPPKAGFLDDANKDSFKPMMAITPNLADVEGPTRNPRSPGLSIEVFSPEPELVRKRSKRYQPY